MVDYTEFFKNDINKGFAQLFSFQTEVLKQATEANAKVAVELLKGTKTVVDAYSKTLEDSIRKLNGV